MSNWEEKSNNNIQGAKLLIRNSLPSTSVHCSYYSNIQLMLHILLSDFGKTEDEINSDSRQGSLDENGFHNWLKNKIARELAIRNFMLVRDFNNFFGQLKSSRIKSDYKNILLSENKAKEALDKSIKINEILKEEFST